MSCNFLLETCYLLHVTCYLLLGSRFLLEIAFAPIVHIAICLLYGVKLEKSQICLGVGSIKTDRQH